MVLKIEPRMVAQADVVRCGGLIEHVEASVATGWRNLPRWRQHQLLDLATTMHYAPCLLPPEQEMQR
jgi:hypothetical protein